MGSACSCCFHVPDVEENVDSSGSNNGNCISLNYFIQNLMNKCGSLFSRREVHVVPSSNHGSASSNSAVARSNSSDTNRPHVGPLPNNASPGYTQLQQDVVISKLLSREDKPFGSYCEGGSKQLVLSKKVETGVGYVYSSLEDEDVCPTCLEEYTQENPKIITQCSHHYHLSCIFEWMERSGTCPFCGKIMEFDEKK